MSKKKVNVGGLTLGGEKIYIQSMLNTKTTDVEGSLAQIRELKAAGFTDSFRCLYPEKVLYSWWSYRFQARAKNAGWRIDYFLVSDRIREKITQADILTDIQGSDHCPVTLEIDV